MGKENQSYKWVVLIIACFFAIIDMSTLSIFSMTGAEITKQLGVTAEYANSFGPWGSLGLFGIWSVGQVIGFLLGGPMYDKIGFRKTLLIAGICLVIPQFIIPNISNFWVVWFLRLVQGLCNVAFVPLVVTSIGWFGAEQGTLALGFLIGSLLAGGTIGNFLASLAAYPGNYYLVGVLCVMSILLAIILGRPSPAAVGSTMVEEDSEAAKEEAVGWGTVLALKETWILGLTLLCGTLMLYPFFAGFGQFALENGVTKSQLAGGSLALTVCFVICAVISGAVTTSMSKKMNPLKAQAAVVMTGFLIMVLGAILMAFLGTNGGFSSWFISCLVFFPLGMGIMMPTFNVMPPLVFNPKVAGTGTGVVTFVGNIVNWATPGIWLGLVVTIGWKGYWLLIVPFMVIGFLLVLSIYRRA